MLSPTFYPYYKEMIDSYKKTTEKVNKYADPLETLEDPTTITRPGKLLGRKKRKNRPARQAIYLNSNYIYQQ